MYDSTTKEFEKLLNGELRKQRPHTHANLRDSQKYLAELQHNLDTTNNDPSDKRKMFKNIVKLVKKYIF